MMSKYMLTDLQCPDCAAAGKLTLVDEQTLQCGRCGSEYPVVAGRPVLISASNRLFNREAYRTAGSRGIYASRTDRKSVV